MTVARSITAKIYIVLFKKMTFTFNPISTLSVAETIDCLYQTAFGNSSVPRHLQLAWWKNYPNGMWGIFLNGAVVGAMSCYPIDRSTYLQIKKGEIREKEISPEKVSLTHLYGFYWSEIVVLPEFRQQQLAQKLINAFWDYHQAFQNYPVLAMAYSSEGSKLLQSQRFINVLSASHQPDQMEVWERFTYPTA